MSATSSPTRTRIKLCGMTREQDVDAAAAAGADPAAGASAGAGGGAAAAAPDASRVVEWSMDEVCAWLQSVRFGELAPAFLRNKVCACVCVRVCVCVSVSVCVYCVKCTCLRMCVLESDVQGGALYVSAFAPSLHSMCAAPRSKATRCCS